MKNAFNGNKSNGSKSLDMNMLYTEFGADTVAQKLGVSAMVYAVVTEPQNKTGYDYSKDEMVTRAVFGKYWNTFLVDVFIVASYSGNELNEIVHNELGYDNMYEKIFDMLNGVTICDGVVI